mmetsp:Transcript_5041/g.16789  ORF Transcript_5041/g.16789 Transcript_5041/m.16789 type:complete len:238 (+) Transcript_5041:60-773(+)
MFMAKRGAVYARLVQNNDRYRAASASVDFGRAPPLPRSEDDTSASNPAFSIASMSSLGPVKSGSKLASAYPSGSRATVTSSTPGTPRKTFSTAPVHAEHVIPSTCSFTTERASSASRTCAASNPASSTASVNDSMRTTAPIRSSTAASPVAADTAARLTPGTPINAASTAPEHAEHVMPSTFSRTRVPDLGGSSRIPSSAIPTKRTRSGELDRPSCEARDRARIRRVRAEDLLRFVR